MKALNAIASVEHTDSTQMLVKVYVTANVGECGDVLVTPFDRTGLLGFAAAPQTVSAGSVTSDLSTTGFVSFATPRAAAGTGMGRVTFTATASGYVSDSDTVEVLEMCQCAAAA